GEVELAAKMLNRPFYLQGLVEKGKSRGRLLGFPTANLVSHAETVPKLGVYATHTLVRGQLLPSVTNVGFNPTFKDGPLTVRVETHILDFAESSYGEEITVQFDSFIRDELRLNSHEE